MEVFYYDKEIKYTSKEFTGLETKQKCLQMIEEEKMLTVCDGGYGAVP